VGLRNLPAIAGAAGIAIWRLIAHTTVASETKAEQNVVRETTQYELTMCIPCPLPAGRDPRLSSA